MSSQLTFSASYQTGNSSNSNSQLVECAMQSNCTAEFAVDITPPVNIIESVVVTVNGTYGSASSMNMQDIRRFILFLHFVSAIYVCMYMDICTYVCTCTSMHTVYVTRWSNY